MSIICTRGEDGGNLDIGQRADCERHLLFAQMMQQLCILNTLDAMVYALHLQEVECLPHVLRGTLLT